MQTYKISINHPSDRPGYLLQEWFVINGSDALAILLDDISDDAKYDCGALSVQVDEVESDAWEF